jgi:hypothetical protein
VGKPAFRSGFASLAQARERAAWSPRKGRLEECENDMARVMRAIAYGLLVGILPVGVFLLAPASVCYRITERYAFSADEPGATVRLAIMLPKSGPYQAVENACVDWAGTAGRELHEGIEVIKLEGTVPDDGALEAVLTYDATLRQGKVTWHSPIREQDLIPQPDIESDAPALVRQAGDLAGESSAESAYRVYAFTAGYLSWPEGQRMGDGASALASYETGIGVCADFANLMTALCRASGTPARSISGLFFPLLQVPYTTITATWMHPAGSHSWVEVYAGDGWLFADPSLGSRLHLDRLWFGRGLAQYLSYGDTVTHDQVYAEMVAWVENGGQGVVGMSAPLKFAAAVGGGQPGIIPTASVKKGWDSRWICAVGLYAAILSASVLVEKHLNRARQGSPAS